MQRRYIGFALAGLLLVAVSAFGVAQFLSGRTTNAALVAAKPSSCNDAYRVLKLAPSLVAAARPVCLTQALQVSGELHGSVGEAYVVDADGVAPAPPCSEPKRWNSFPQASLAFVIGNKPYRLRISPAGVSEHRSVTFNNVAGKVELASIADPKADWNQPSGTVGLNADGVTGNIDVDLLRNVSGARPTHVSGQWSCGIASPPAAEGSVPCAAFYTLNHLRDADVARMKAQACVAQDLTLTGAISGHLDHAVNDAAIRPHPGIDGDNYCGGIGNQYDSSLKFSIGDESFLLNLNPRAYPSVGPGRYEAGAGVFSANAFLWLGQADPDRNGLFVPDQHVFWYGSGGNFTIATDMKSGTIDETFSGALGHSGSTLHITGSWRCAS